MFVPTLYHDNIFDDFDNFFGLMDMPQRRDPPVSYTHLTLPTTNEV